MYPVWNGPGTVRLTILGADGKPPSKELIDEVQEAVDPEQNHGQGIGIAPIGHTVTVTGVQSAQIDITTRITFADGWGFDTAETQIRQTIQEYFCELAVSWADEAATIVRIAQVESKLLALSCVLDITDTQFNGAAHNVQLNSDAIPELGRLEVIT